MKDALGSQPPSPSSNQLPSLRDHLRHHQHEYLPRPSLTGQQRVGAEAGGRSLSATSLERLLSADSDDTAAAASWSETSSTVSDPSPRESPSDGDAKRKRPRFLGDIDRRIIIQRLENGERQADLAREFGVTRAAICHINKNRDEIITRFDILAKSPQGRQMIENYVRSPHVSSLVRELRTPSVSVLLTRLRGGVSSSAAFKSAADRLMGILLEEALVSFGTKAVGVEDVHGTAYEGKEYARPTLALGVGDNAAPLLKVFASMEPTAQRAVVHSDGTLPAALLENAATANVLLLQVGIYDAPSVSRVVETLLACGVTSSQICVVCVTASADAITALASRHREVKVVAAVIDTDADAPRLAGFVERYAAAATSA